MTSSTVVQETRDLPRPRCERELFAVETGDVIGGRYRVRREIGRGGMGLVLEVEELSDGRVYALKVCRLGGASLRRFAREVRLMGRVRHPHVVPVLFADLSAERPYFVMPLALGSLEDELGGLAGREEEALDVFRQVCLGVRALHGSGIVHRDIKPANVLRLQSGRYAVSDLGVAKLEARDTTSLTQSRAVVGTLAFLAPEQFLPEGSRRADVRTDVYQLGKVLYQLLTGRSPAVVEPESVPRGMDHILLRATSGNPADRYRDLGEFLDALHYYRMARDPTRNAREALECATLQAEALLKRREYRAENVREVLALLAPREGLEPAAVIERFDRLPDGLLPVLAGAFAAEFLPVLRAYAAALHARVSSYAFRYADDVARRMRSVFFATSHPGVKTAALQATLVAAVGLNRYAAMHAFNRLLMSVRTLEVALPVAEMLRAHTRHYAKVAEGAPADRLHPAILDAQRDPGSASDAAG